MLGHCLMHLDTLRKSSEDCGSSKIVSAEYRKKIQERCNWVSPTEIEFWGCEKLGNQMHRWLQLSILFFQWTPFRACEVWPVARALHSWFQTSIKFWGQRTSLDLASLWNHLCCAFLCKQRSGCGTANADIMGSICYFNFSGILLGKSLVAEMGRNFSTIFVLSPLSLSLSLSLCRHKLCQTNTGSNKSLPFCSMLGRKWEESDGHKQ